MRINRYTETVIKQRATPDLYDPTAIDSAGAGFRTAAGVLDIGAKYIAAEQEAKNKSWLNKALIENQRRKIDLSYQKVNDPNVDPNDFAKRFEEETKLYNDEQAKSAPSEEARQLFMERVADIDLGIYEQNLGWQRKKTVETLGVNLEIDKQNLHDSATIRGLSGQSVEDLYKQADATTASAAGILSPQELYLNDIKLRQAIDEGELQGLLNSDPEKLINQTKTGKYSLGDITFDDAVKQVMELEGGFVSNDGGKGETLFGINSEANPKEYADMKAAYDAGNTQKAEQIAVEAYKRKYWDAIGAETLPKKIALVAFDAAVNQGVGATKKMLSQANGDVKKFIELRRERYRAAITADPNKAQYYDGWMNRLDKMQGLTHSSQLPPEVILQYRNDAEKVLKVKRTKQLAEQLRYTNIAEAQRVAVENEDDTLLSIVNKNKELVYKDPAGYVAQHPDIAALDNELKNAPDADVQNQIFAKRSQRMKEIQMEMGLEEYETSIVPQEYSKKIADMFMDKDASADQVLENYNQYMAQFAGYEDDANESVVKAGLKGPLTALLQMGHDTDKIGMIKAIRNSEDLEKITPETDKKTIKKSLQLKSEKYSRAFSHLQNSAELSEAQLSAAQKLSYYYKNQGMDNSAASQKAIQEVYEKNFKIVRDTVAVPAGADTAKISGFLGKKSEYILKHDVFVPPGVSEINKQTYLLQISKYAEPRTVGNKIVFFDHFGVPILDASKIKVDSNGDILNAKDAAIGMTIEDAQVYGQEVRRKTIRRTGKGSGISMPNTEGQ